MAARTQEIVKGKQNVILIKKPGDSTFTLVGCLSKYDFEVTVEAVDVACRQYSGKSPSGDDAQWQVQIEGIQHVYETGNVDANVSASEMEDYTLAQEILEVKIGGTLVGDPIRTGKGFFTSYKETNDQKGNATYSVTLVGTEVYTKSVVPS